MGKSGGFRKQCTRGGKEKLRVQWHRNDDYVKHILREHIQETDHLSNLRTEGQRKVTIEIVNNTEE